MKKNIYVWMGFGLVVFILLFAMFGPDRTGRAYQIIWAVLAGAMAMMLYLLPGQLEVKVNGFVKAGGAAAIFVFVYLFAPQVGQAPESNIVATNKESTTSHQSEPTVVADSEKSNPTKPNVIEERNISKATITAPSTPPVIPNPVQLTGDAKQHVDWAIGNTGHPNCADQYIATYPACLLEGNRSCLMRKAIESARSRDCNNAVRLTLITQCHSSSAQQQIAAAGADAVCTYLASR
jgi:hypothetical protein